MYRTPHIPPINTGHQRNHQDMGLSLHIHHRCQACYLPVGHCAQWHQWNNNHGTQIIQEG